MQQDWSITLEMDDFKWFAIMMIGAFAAVAIASFSPSETQSVNDKKWNDCIESVNRAMPDPNAFEERSELLKSCYEN